MTNQASDLRPASQRSAPHRRFCYGLAVTLFVAMCGYSAWIESGGKQKIARRTGCLNNLHNISLALQNYHQKYGCFPPAYIADKDGRPMHSWRTLILPYVDRQDLYDAYRFDEPWDGPNNRKLTELSIDVFHCPDDDQARGSSTPMTSYLAIIGPKAAWSGATPVKLAEVTDLASTTLLVVEVTNSGIHWAEPRDLHVLQMAPTINPGSGQGISSRHQGGANVGMIDGLARFLPETLSAAEVRGLITTRGGENVLP